MKHLINWRLAIAGLALATFGLTACGGNDTKSSDSTSANDALSEITIDKQLARTSPAGTTTGAAYMTLTSSTDDALIGVSVDSSIAESVELHEMVMMSTDSSMSGDMNNDMGNGMDHSSMSDHNMSGEMKMQQVMMIELPAGKTVKLKPGGLHVMFINLAKPLQTGETITLTLTFQNSGDVVIDVPVQEDAP
jgi:copper(I)-binding protein